jgi:hypothetical protein
MLHGGKSSCTLCNPLLLLLLLLFQVTLLDSLRKRCDFLQATAAMLGETRLAVLVTKSTYYLFQRWHWWQFVARCRVPHVNRLCPSHRSLVKLHGCVTCWVHGRLRL